jgi:hypothetical protein
MSASAVRRRENRALVKAWSRSVFADRERIGEVHRADPGDWLAVDFAGRIIGAFAEEPAAVAAVLDAARRRS